MSKDHVRPGEVWLENSDILDRQDAHLVFIGHIETPWATRADCPRNVRRAREAGTTATLKVSEEFRLALTGLNKGEPIVVLYWLDQAERDLLLQMPKHVESGRGTFSLRSPVRPNPIGLATARILMIDTESGEIEVEGLDCVNKTPLIDIKPHLDTIDIPTP